MGRNPKKTKMPSDAAPCLFLATTKDQVRAYCNVVFQLRPAQQTSAAKRNHGDYDQNDHDDHENG